MTKYRVYVQTTATAVVEVEVPDGVTDPDEISQIAADKGEFPTLSAKASGWGEKWSLELGDWEDVIEDGKPYVEPIAAGE